MDNFANNLYTFGKIRLVKRTLGNFTNGNLTLGNFTNGNLTLGKFTQVYLPWINLPLDMVLKKLKLVRDWYFSKLNIDSCVKFLYTKNGKFVTKIAYVQDNILPQHQNFTKACM